MYLYIVYMRSKLNKVNCQIFFNVLGRQVKQKESSVMVMINTSEVNLLQHVERIHKMILENVMEYTPKLCMNVFSQRTTQS